MADGQKTTSLPLTITPDDIPEFEEKFSVTLNHVTGGAGIGSLAMCDVVIMENDYPYGLIGMLFSYK